MDQYDARHERVTASRGRARGHVARRGLRGWTVGVVAVSVLAGMLFALSATTSQGRPLRPQTVTQVDLLREAQARRDALQAQVNALEELNDATTAARGTYDSAIRDLRDAAAEVAPTAGFAAVRGPALTVTLSDAPRGAPVISGVSPDDLVVHQQDVQAVVNALWRGGAEAMMLMDQRVIATSAVRCVGNTLILQGRVYSPPYVISAIGDVEGMQNALILSPEVSIYRQFVDLVQLGYSVDEVGVTAFPAYDGPPSLRYARPVSGTRSDTTG